MRGRRTSWSSLVFGLVFIGVGIIVLTDRVDLVTRLRWAGPIFLIVVAFCLIVSVVVDRPRPALGPPVATSSVPLGGPAGRPDAGSHQGAGEPFRAPDGGGGGGPAPLPGDHDPDLDPVEDDAKPPV